MSSAYKYKVITDCISEGGVITEFQSFVAVNFPQNGAKNNLGDLVIDLIIYDKMKDRSEEERYALMEVAWDLYEELTMSDLYRILEVRGITLEEDVSDEFGE